MGYYIIIAYINSHNMQKVQKNDSQYYILIKKSIINVKIILVSM